MKKHLLFLAALGVAALCHAPSARAQLYKIDDGTAEDAYGFGNGSTNNGSIWLDEFTVTGQFNKLSSVSIAWGSPGGGNENVSGLPMQALLYSDPNGDGSPSDGVLLSSVAGTIQNVGTNTFVTYAFPSPITVSTANFFVGFYVPGFAYTSGSEQYFAAIDESTGNIPTRSFVYANTDGSNPNLTSLSSNNFGGSNATFGIAGNWLVRANAVPEPSTWAAIVAGLGTLAAVGARRRKARA